jgi:hypothetical protein
MLLGNGGGSISVESAALEAMAGQIANVSAGTSSARGSFSGAAGSADGCQAPAAGSFAMLQSLLAGALTLLDDSSVLLSRNTASAAVAYAATDAAQMPGSIESCQAVP